MKQTTTIRIGGEGGEGVISAGEILTLTSARFGWHIFSSRTYPAEIKGGLAVYQFRISEAQVGSQGDQLDIAVCLTAEAYDECRADVSPNTYIVFDPMEIAIEKIQSGKAIPIPFTEIAKKQVGAAMSKNAVVVGVLARFIGLPLELASTIFTAKFGNKRAASTMMEANAKAIHIGYELAAGQNINLRPQGTPSPENRLVLSGNQAIALGALAANCKYVAGYPITPATPILETLARELPKFDGSFVQTEDEMAALASCLGAGFAGVRAMTATSGPGFALMSELMSLGVMAEVPVVIVNVQRAGPSTGMPTKTEQGDLLYALYGSPGESPRIVLAPATVTEAFSLMPEAFTIAELVQCPVIVLSDQSLGYRLETVSRGAISIPEISQVGDSSDAAENDTPFLRYRDTASGVSPHGVPGTASPVFIVGGLEHNEAGQPDYTPENHLRMAAKRERKLAVVKTRAAWQLGWERAGIENGIGIISWGSTFGVVDEAIRMLELTLEEKFGHFHVRWINPFPIEEISAWADCFARVFVVEENFSGQLETLLRAQTNLTPVSIRKSAGVPFAASEIHNRIVENIKGKLHGVPQAVRLPG
ncbi:MAG: 2-oxoacid:acceptor oxidoreductase subunit alpha [bacterium]|nr:2-oxoacid:acceptor oxidoreductase subunit alpha [bacterium]